MTGLAVHKNFPPFVMPSLYELHSALVISQCGFLVILQKETSIQDKSRRQLKIRSRMARQLQPFLYRMYSEYHFEKYTMVLHKAVHRIPIHFELMIG